MSLLPMGGAFLILLALAPLVPQQSDRGPASEPDWAEGAVRWLLTEEELSRWEALISEQETSSFIDQFWTRRDPTPDTSANEARHLFRQRQADADQRFSLGRQIGSLSDRGRVLILMGSPSAIAEVRAEAGNPPGEIWFWEGDSRPSWAEEPSLSVTFVDEYGTGSYRIALIERRRVEELLARARDGWPDWRPAVAKAPVPPANGTVPPAVLVDLERAATTFESAALEEAWKDYEPPDGPAQIHLTYGEFLTSAGQYYVPMQLYVPASSGFNTSGELRLFGAVTDRNGELIAVYDEPATLAVTGTDAYLDRTLVLDPGTYTATFGLARDESPIAMTHMALELKPLQPGKPGVSRLVLSSNVVPLMDTRLVTAPFVFGNLKVVPKGNRRFRTREQIWYALELRNPGLDGQGRPRVEVRVAVEGEKLDGAPVRMGAPAMATDPQPIRNQPGRFLVGGSLAREALEPGSYEIHLQITDEISGQVWDAQQQFEILE